MNCYPSPNGFYYYYYDDDDDDDDDNDGDDNNNCSNVKYIIITIAGTGARGSSGDGGAATSAQLSNTYGVSVDISGNVYIADGNNNKIRKVTSTGIITTFAGTGSGGSSGDGGAATSAQLNSPVGMSVDISGNVYFADYSNNKIRMVSSIGIITTIAGTGAVGSSGDGGAATSAQLCFPRGVSVDISGNVYIADTFNNKIRMVTSKAIITTFAGTGTFGSGGDGGAAISAQLSNTYGVSLDISGNVYITDTNNHKIRMVTSTGIITTIAGTGVMGSSGDGGAATSAQLASPEGVSVDISGNVYIADTGNYKFRLVTSTGIITTIAGTGTAGSSGDGGAATSAPLSYPWGVSVDILGNVYIADGGNNKIRMVLPQGRVVSLPTGQPSHSPSRQPSRQPTSRPTITNSPQRISSPTGQPSHQPSQPAIPVPSDTVFGSPKYYAGTYEASACDTTGCSSSPCPAGRGCSTSGCFGGPITSAVFGAPGGFAINQKLRRLYFVDSTFNTVRYINMTSGIINTIDMHSAVMSEPGGMAIDKSGNLYVADAWGHALQFFQYPFSSAMTTINAPSLYYWPRFVTLDSSGNVYTDGNCVVGFIDAITNAGSIFAGDGTCNSNGDGGPATSAGINVIRGVAIDERRGIVYISEAYSQKIRAVNLVTRIISTIAGISYNCYSGCGDQHVGWTGDGGPATSATLNGPSMIAVMSNGGILFADQHAIRYIQQSTGYIYTVIGNSSNIISAPTFVLDEAHGKIYVGNGIHNTISTVNIAVLGSQQPTAQPSEQPSTQPSRQPSMQPSEQPTEQPSMQPSRYMPLHCYTPVCQCVNIALIVPHLLFH